MAATTRSLGEAILSGRGIQDWGIYDDAPGVESARTDYATTMGGITAMPVADPLIGAPSIQIIYHAYGWDYWYGFRSATCSAIRIITTTPVGGTTGGLCKPTTRCWSLSSRREAEYALHELRDAGFNMDNVSVVAKDADRGDEIAGVDMSDRVGNKADEGATTGAVTGGAVGGLTGLLVGLGALAIPGIGPVMLAVATALATALSGGAIGAAAGGLLDSWLGIPEERARVITRDYPKEIIVFVDGTDDEIRRAGAILSNRGFKWGIYDASSVDTARSDYPTTNAPAVDTVRTDYPSSVSNTDPKVIIVDRRTKLCRVLTTMYVLKGCILRFFIPW